MTTLSEAVLVDLLVQRLVPHGFVPFEELQLDSHLIFLRDVAPNTKESQSQSRIDAAFVHPLDGSITFVEAESSFYVEHATTYVGLADHVFLLIDDKAWSDTPEEVRNQQIAFAKNHRVGIITISFQGHVKVKVDALLQHVEPTVRSSVLARCHARQSAATPTPIGDVTDTDN